MRKILTFLVVGVILTSMSFASVGKLNVWVRDINCEVVDEPGYLIVYTCHGNLIMYPYFPNGHAEVDVPPGCYIIMAKLCISGVGNIQTDKTMVIVKCGKETCVNLFLPNFAVDVDTPVVKQAQLEKQPLMLYYCPAAILPALIVNAGTADIKPEELQATIDVIARAARIDKEILLDVVRDEIKFVEAHIPKCKHKKEREKMKEYINKLKKAL